MNKAKNFLFNLKTRKKKKKKKNANIIFYNIFLI